MKKSLLFLSMLWLSTAFGQHKFLNVPDLDDADLKSEKSAKFGDVPAEILYQSVQFRIDYDGTMHQNVVSRVKIYNKDNASDYLDQEIGVYDDGHGSRETISGLKAYTHNYENGKKVSTKIAKDERYKSKEDKNYTITKFAFSNVKNGSVVEYSYSIVTPFLGSTPRILIEEEIPIRYTEFILDAPKPLGYSINYKGSLEPTNRDVAERNLYGGEYNTYRFAYENVPAYKEEMYVMNNNNYKTGIKAELNSTFINGEFKSYANSWEDIRKRLYDHDDFGGQLSKESLVKNLLSADIKSLPTMEKAKAILKFVQKNYVYNEEDDVVAGKGVKELISSKIGNSADINLLLVMLLRNAGINADPAVMATTNKGSLLAYNPSISQLNYVVATFNDNNKLYLLDGSYKHSEINMIAPKALNYIGLVMSKSDVKQINIVYPEVSKTYLTVDAKLGEDGTFSGNFKDRDTKLYAMVVNERYTDDADHFAKTYKDEYKFALNNMKHGLQENNDFETSFDFTSDTFVDAIGNKMIFNPLLFLYTQNHDFKQSGERKAPLEFYSANDRIKKVTITLPEGYVFENVPKSKKFRTDDNSLQYTYLVTQEGNKLTVETITQVDDWMFPKEYYPAFTQIYDNITTLEAQVVTAVKK